MIGDNAKAIIANMSKNVRVTRTIPISLSANRIHEADVISRTPGAYRTNGVYILRYSPNEIYDIKKGKPFLLKIDLLDTIEKIGHRVVDFEDFCNSETYKEFVPFLLKYTSISQELFDLAEANPTLDIPFSIDVLRYVSDVKEKNGIEGEFNFLSEIGSKLNDYKENEKLISRNNSRNRKLKGVVDK